ncbi:MAG: G5 domain-containing protein [Clostridioides sp.]|jgi:3D (Asp-Asp-Asp) domain-containing protein/sRNA-binding carbon storage regulator CsrA|nr:G5 domain-containing protein [Clostridioides sp.]
MNEKKRNNTKVSVIAVVLSFVILSGYSMLNKEVVLVVNGQEKSINTIEPSVERVLKVAKVDYDENDIINVKPTDLVSDGDKIEVISVNEKTVKETVSIPFDTKIVRNELCTLGKTEVTTEGKEGKKEITYKEIYHNEKLESKEIVSSEVLSEPITKVVTELPDVEVSTDKTSTKSVSSVDSSSKQSDSSNGKTMKVVATAYCGDSVTSTGTRPKWGTIAVDPRVLPYGTKVYIPQFDMVFTAEDCGGAIKGNKIDIFMTSSSQMSAWGRKTITIKVLN